MNIFFFFQAEDGIRDLIVTGVQTCALPISTGASTRFRAVLGRSGWARARTTTGRRPASRVPAPGAAQQLEHAGGRERDTVRSEEHTSELQSRSDLVCRLLLEKKKQIYEYIV